MISWLPFYLYPTCANPFVNCTSDASVFAIPILVFGIFSIIFKSTSGRSSCIRSLCICMVVACGMSILFDAMNQYISLMFMLPWFFLHGFRGGDMSEFFIRKTMRCLLFTLTVGSLAPFVTAILYGRDFSASVFHGYYNYYQDMLIVLLCCFFGLVAELKKYRSVHYVSRVFFIVLTLFVFCSVVFSGSRSSIVFISLLLIFHNPLILLSVLFVLYFSYVFGFLDEYIYDKVEYMINKDPSSGRYDIYESVLDNLSWLPKDAFDTSLSSAHSGYLELLSLYGLLPSVLMLVYIFLVVFFFSRSLLGEQRLLFLGLMLGFFLGPFAFNAPLRQLAIIASLLFLFFLYKSFSKNRIESIGNSVQ